MTHNPIHSEKDKLFPLEGRNQPDQIILECGLTDHLQRQVDYYNSNYLRNFQLIMEVQE